MDITGLKTNLHRFKSKEIKADDRGRYFDMMVAAYLINPLVGEYPYDAVAKDYLGLCSHLKRIIWESLILLR